MRFQEPLIPPNIAVEDDSLPSDDDSTSSDSETEQDDVPSDDNIMSGSDSDDGWTDIVGSIPWLIIIF